MSAQPASPNWHLLNAATDMSRVFDSIREASELLPASAQGDLGRLMVLANQLTSQLLNAADAARVAELAR